MPDTIILCSFSVDTNFECDSPNYTTEYLSVSSDLDTIDNIDAYNTVLFFSLSNYWYLLSNGIFENTVNLDVGSWLNYFPEMGKLLGVGLRSILAIDSLSIVPIKLRVSSQYIPRGYINVSELSLISAIPDFLISTGYIYTDSIQIPISSNLLTKLGLEFGVNFKSSARSDFGCGLGIVLPFSTRLNYSFHSVSDESVNELINMLFTIPRVEAALLYAIPISVGYSVSNNITSTLTMRNTVTSSSIIKGSLEMIIPVKFLLDLLLGHTLYSSRYGLRDENTLSLCYYPTSDGITAHSIFPNSICCSDENVFFAMDDGIYVFDQEQESNTGLVIDYGDLSLPSFKRLTDIVLSAKFDEAEVVTVYDKSQVVEYSTPYSRISCAKGAKGYSVILIVNNLLELDSIDTTMFVYSKRGKICF